MNLTRVYKPCRSCHILASELWGVNDRQGLVGCGVTCDCRGGATNAIYFDDTHPNQVNEKVQRASKSKKYAGSM